MASITKTTTSVNVNPGDPINFNVKFTVSLANVQFLSFSDPLPGLNGPTPGSYSISSQSTPWGSFSITGTAPVQNLVFTPGPGFMITGFYDVVVTATTTVGPDDGQTFPNTAILTYRFNTNTVTLPPASATASVVVCIHKTSMIQLADGQELGISDLLPGQEIMSADGSVSQIIESVPCWITDKNNVCGKAVIFEPDSLGPGVPSKRFAIDPGHPMALPEDYKKHGNEALRPAKTYLDEIENKEIYLTMWDKVSSLLPGENRRYDIVMKDDSCKAYIANGIVVKARQNRVEPGYSYS